METTAQNGQSAILDPPVARELHDVSLPGAAVRADMTGRGATLRVGEPGGTTDIEITPTGSLPGDFFVGTFDGPRMIALARLSEDYAAVEKIDLIHMVRAERDVSAFPRIAVVDDGDGKLLQVIGGGERASLQVYELPAA